MPKIYTLAKDTEINGSDKLLGTDSTIGANNATKNYVIDDLKTYIITNASGINAASISDGSVSNTEFGYLDGVTSSIQTQLDGKQSVITGAATTIDDTDLTASRALVSSATGKVEVSLVTSTELGYLDGVTSAIQTQIDAKQNTLVSGTNIKTINFTSLVGGGNISVAPSSGIDAVAIADGSVSSTEFQYLDGVTSGIQGQIDQKIPKYLTQFPGGSNKSISALAAMSQAEYNGIIPDANTIYFII